MGVERVLVCPRFDHDEATLIVSVYMEVVCDAALFLAHQRDSSFKFAPQLVDPTWLGF